MSAPIGSRRPYLIRAIYDWAVDNGLTPYLLVAADQAGVVAPASFARDGRIAFDLSPSAVRGLDLQRDPLYFSARFGGVAHDIWVPSGAVLAIYARENGEGVLFGEPEASTATPEEPPPDAPKPGGRPKLRVVK